MKIIYTYELGFNLGYVCQSLAPEIMATIISQTQTNQHDYIQGLRDGANELTLEHQQVRLDELNRLREGGHDLTRDRE